VESTEGSGQCRQLSRKIKVLLDFFQKIVGFQRATPLVAFRRKRNLYDLRAFLLLFAIEKEAEFEAEPHKLLSILLKLMTLGFQLPWTFG
jgi:hypothetical protein